MKTGFLNMNEPNDPEYRLQRYLHTFGLRTNNSCEIGSEQEWGASKKIVVLLSGGVDSSVALAALKRCGTKDLEAYYLKIWFDEADQFLGDCPWQEDLDYAAAVCEQFDVPLHIISLQDEYYRYVVEYTLTQLRRARTPSPDIFCNSEIKFGAFRKFLRQRYAGKPTPLIASGHYALLQPLGQELLLQQGVDPQKDQSYFLSQLSQQQLQGLLFPLGCLEKSEVRTLAKRWGLPTAGRKDSQGICFLGKLKFRDFIAHYLGEQPGPIVEWQGPDKDGVILGEHRGLWFHTIGQRQGLGLAGGPWYVWSKDTSTNRLYVRHADSQSPDQWLRCFWVGEVCWLQSEESRQRLYTQRPNGPLQLKLRHGPVKLHCTMKKRNFCQDLPKLSVRSFEQSQHQNFESWRICIERGDRGIAPGQFAVFYWGDICLGSAEIQQLGDAPSPHFS